MAKIGNELCKLFQQIGCLSLPSISFPDPFVFDLSSYQVKGATQRRLGGLVTTYQVLIIHTSV